jgi:hypothetical protein
MLRLKKIGNSCCVDYIDRKDDGELNEKECEEEATISGSMRLRQEIGPLRACLEVRGRSRGRT